MSNTLHGAALREKHNPILALFPQEPGKRKRPGAWRAGQLGWGDYHPSSIEFFIARAHLRTSPPHFDPVRPLRPSFWSWSRLERTGLEVIQSQLRAPVEPEETHDWELDVADIPSQDETKAWRTYGTLLDETRGDHPYRCEVYGRFVEERRTPEAEPVPALQYWYLYIYNDFRNNHEADWEMVTIELSSDGRPVQVGLSSHHGGSRREWAKVRKVEDKLLVHVALGSHAGYFEYRPKGYRLLNLAFRSNLPPGLSFVQSALRLPVAVLQRLPRIRRWRDLPPADRELDVGADTEHIGVRVSPQLRLLPDAIDQAPDSEWWWLRYRGKWGSTRPRFFGTVGIDTPWGRAGHDPRWEHPVAWLRSLPSDSV